MNTPSICIILVIAVLISCNTSSQSTPTQESNLLLLSDGSQLSYYEYGNLNGTPVFYFHGFPGSHEDIQLFNGDELAEHLNIRLIAVNRPGYSDSSAQPGRTLLEWPENVSTLADHLDIKEFSILAYSGGAPFGLACAYAIPERIKTVSIVSGMGPVNAPMAKKGGAMLIPKAPNLILKGMIKMMLKKPDKFEANMKKGFPEVDQVLLEKPDVIDAMMETMHESLRSGRYGALADAKIYKHEWGFDLSQINQEVMLWHGKKDQNVRLESAQYVAETLPNCESNILSEEGHLSLIYNHAEEILSKLSQ